MLRMFVQFITTRFVPSLCSDTEQIPVHQAGFRSFSFVRLPTLRVVKLYRVTSPRLCGKCFGLKILIILRNGSQCNILFSHFAILLIPSAQLCRARVWRIRTYSICGYIKFSHQLTCWRTQVKIEDEIHLIRYWAFFMNHRICMKRCEDFQMWNPQSWPLFF